MNNLKTVSSPRLGNVAQKYKRNEYSIYALGQLYSPPSSLTHVPQSAKTSLNHRKSNGSISKTKMESTSKPNSSRMKSPRTAFTERPIPKIAHKKSPSGLFCQTTILKTCQDLMQNIDTDGYQTSEYSHKPRQDKKKQSASKLLSPITMQRTASTKSRTKKMHTAHRKNDRLSPVKCYTIDSSSPLKQSVTQDKLIEAKLALIRETHDHEKSLIETRYQLCKSQLDQLQQDHQMVLMQQGSQQDRFDEMTDEIRYLSM